MIEYANEIPLSLDHTFRVLVLKGDLVNSNQRYQPHIVKDRGCPEAARFLSKQSHCLECPFERCQYEEVNK